jgi:hypothetical protein
MRTPRKSWRLIDALEAAKASGGRVRIALAEGDRAVMLHRFGVCMTAVKNGYLEFVSGPIQVEAVFKLTIKGYRLIEKEGQKSPL